MIFSLLDLRNKQMLLCAERAACDITALFVWVVLLFTYTLVNR